MSNLEPRDVTFNDHVYKIQKKYKFIARDENGEIWAYTLKPLYNNEDGWYNSPDGGQCVKVASCSPAMCDEIV